VFRGIPEVDPPAAQIPSPVSVDLQDAVDVLNQFEAEV
jgi:hypothetical protein